MSLRLGPLGSGSIRRFAVLCALGLGALPAAARWSTDPARSLVIGDGPSEQAAPKVVARTDGGCYVAWLDNSTGGYDVRLQRFDAAGNELWPHNGIRVADRGYAAADDYDLAIDDGGNALLAFRDDSTAPERIVAAKINANGAALWGTPGVAVSDSTGLLGSPRITALSGNFVAVAWNQDSDVVLQRLESIGAEQWPHGGVALAHSGDTFALAGLLRAEFGSVVVSWVRSTTPGGERQLWAQKLDNAASLIWGAGHVQLFDLAGSSLAADEAPASLADGAGGAVFAWATSTPALQVRAQRLLANGSETFAHNGLELSTDTTRGRRSPSVAFDPVTLDLYAFWVEQNGAATQFGLSGQRLDAAGARQWTASGLTVLPLSATPLAGVTAFFAHGATLAWSETPGFDDQPIRATRLDASGSASWNPAIVDVKSSATGTAALAGALMPDESVVYAWSDTEAVWDVKGQNLHLDGSIGEPPLFVDGFESGDTSAWSAASP